ncbi:universal stress protein [Desulfotruncus alcoholivorax]|uniref:universal stress protein n=1 Tax=Desulfotruncus alcoholivorax TaxID=265477 RepID=UPI0003FA27C2|nr:universal stress protein [Desulfotruncus alcoholivorax]
MFKKILVAYDGSAHAQNALEVAIDLAQKYSSFIGVVSVINLPDFAGTVSEVDDIMMKANEFYREHHAQVANLLQQNQVPFQLHIEYGHSGNKIVKFAGENKFNLILTGARGHNKIQQIILGSTSSYIVQHAPCAVMVIKQLQL